ncbi:hypothetical protein N7509_003314 [Penicillium cosmopolitanum]|uniref:Uncharacterized protein n=1 Tax=Penicillium cosmopolitanum TaxID=1131564 RepID=A0A9W9W4Q1_9EURO|nr:uncharacterized protein N7509_003314 [Penicillium cosmopolitanum]KAJ5403443.1 hypothetical protein N7509_003314 [Penicillium cosmopolitanum]
MPVVQNMNENAGPDMTDLDTSSDWPAFPGDDTLHEAYEIELETQNGDTVRFGELVAGKGDSITTIVIFGENLRIILPIPRPSIELH